MENPLKLLIYASCDWYISARYSFLSLIFFFLFGTNEALFVVTEWRDVHSPLLHMIDVCFVSFLFALLSLFPFHLPSNFFALIRQRHRVVFDLQTDRVLCVFYIYWVCSASNVRASAAEIRLYQEFIVAVERKTLLPCHFCFVGGGTLGFFLQDGARSHIIFFTLLHSVRFILSLIAFPFPCLTRFHPFHPPLASPLFRPLSYVVGFFSSLFLVRSTKTVFGHSKAKNFSLVIQKSREENVQNFERHEPKMRYDDILLKYEHFSM